MFKGFFGSDADPGVDVLVALTSADRQEMVNILCNAASMMPFTTAEARVATTYMSSRSYHELEVIIEEGGRTNLDYMLWVLDGEVTFEGLTGGGVGQPITVNVIGAGSALGAMSMVDGQPRSLHGVATMPTRCAMLTRAQLQKLCREQPNIGNKLMAVLCLIFSQTLRSLTTKFKCHVRLNNVLSEELREQEAASLRFDQML